VVNIRTTVIFLFDVAQRWTRVAPAVNIVMSGVWL
jgi:hypothetical protein